MQREIFIGSSSEGLQEAQRVASILSADPEVVPVSWTEVFQPGYLAFEALETVLRRCCGAVFVAGPDDQSTIRGRTVRLPRANIMNRHGLICGNGIDQDARIGYAYLVRRVVTPQTK